MGSIDFSVEDNTSTDEMQYESEISLIGYMKNPDKLIEADRTVDMEQYTIRVDRKDGVKGNIRVRKSKEIHPEPDTKYWSTIKNTLEKTYMTLSSETNIEVNSLFFQSFSDIAEMSTHKVRYTFCYKDFAIKVIFKDGEEEAIVPNIEFEVDVFHISGEVSKWVKIDIELDAIKEYLYHHYFFSDYEELIISTDHLPIELVHIFNTNKPTEEEKKIEDALYSKEIFGMNF
jgi:hypothetical protein